MAGDGRIRLFCALQLPAAAVDRIGAWQASELRGRAAAAARLVPPESLHVTLAFLGGRPADEVPVVAAALRAAAGSARPVELRPAGYRETRSVAMILLEDLGGAGAALAADLGERLQAIGVYRRERRPWLAHVTVLRFRERPRLGPAPPEGNIRSVRCALYRSSLGPGGARYDVLESVALGGR